MARKVKNLFNVDSYKKLPQMIQDSRGYRKFADSLANRGIVLERTLEGVDPTIFEKKYPENTFLNTGIEIDNSGGFLESVTSLRVDDEGGFAAAGTGGNNKGQISVYGDSSTIAVTERTARSNWTYTQLQQAAMEGRSLVDMIVSAHNRIYLRELDAIMYLGIAELGTEGLLNNSDIATDTSVANFATLTGEALYNFIAKLINAQHTQVSNTPEYMATHVRLPISMSNQMRSDFVNSNGGTVTVEKALQQNFPGMDFAFTKHANSVEGSPVIAVFSSDYNVMKGRVPVTLEIGEIVKLSSFKDELESMYRTAGLDLLEPYGAYLARQS